MPLKDHNPHSERHVRYFLSLDPRLEEGWVYRADLKPGNRFDLVNELGSSSRPVVEGASVGDYKLVELPPDVYDRVVELRASGWDDAISDAEALIRPFMKQGRNDHMYLVERVEGTEAVIQGATAQRPFGPGFGIDDLAGVDAMEVWGTQFTEGVSDYVEFRLLRDGAVIKSRRVEGY